MAVFTSKVIPCPPEAHGEALEILYHRVPAVLRDRVIINVLAEAQRGEIDLSGLWIACEQPGRVLARLLTQSARW